MVTENTDDRLQDFYIPNVDYIVLEAILLTIVKV
ncbi:hypothetical protein BWGOE3_25020 [Bacillus mycoides]|nr:hypothetical protein BWGOE3_25020 [Bacillus mycoides]